jgi:hypothetical protein
MSARRQPLAGVAHNIGHSFTSRTNYAYDDYTLGHLLHLANKSKRDTFTIDFIAGQAGPPELLARPMNKLSDIWISAFWEMAEQQGSARSLVKSATLRLHFDLNAARPHNPQYPRQLAYPYTCQVEIMDDHGHSYTANFEGRWILRSPTFALRKLRLWWKFLSKF